MSTESRNQQLREACQHFRSLTVGPIDRDVLEMLVLHQMELRSEAERQFDLCPSLGSRIHWMQRSALSEIIGWTERAIDYLQNPEQSFKFPGGNQLQHSDGSCTPALVFDWMFSSLGQWMNHELLNGSATAQPVAV